MNVAYLGVGSNLEPQLHCQRAIHALSQIGGTLRLSNAYHSQAVGFEGPSFINLVVEISTELSLTELADKCRDIENQLGRQRSAQKFQSRTIDIDILLFNQQVSQSPQLPRDDITKFAFVLKPLFELAPQLSVPVENCTVEELWQKHQARLTELQPITKIELEF